MHRRCLLTLIMIIFAAAVLVSMQSAFAQLRIVGSISGIVQDPTGAVVANARVVLKDQKTGLTKESTTTEAGTFLFPDLASGSYQLTVSLAGFKTELVPSVSVSTSQTTDVRIGLEVEEERVLADVAGGNLFNQLARQQVDLVGQQHPVVFVALDPGAHEEH